MTDTLTLIIEVFNSFQTKTKMEIFQLEKACHIFWQSSPKSQVSIFTIYNHFSKSDVFERKVPIHSMKKQNVLAKNLKNYFREFLLV